jgi:hypothetical protein
MAAPAIAVDKVSYTDLYERWEKGNWRATELDFTVDREHWHNEFTELQRRSARWNYSLFFHGEDAVADGLTPYIEAAPLEEHKYFLTTQQVDEARHSVFFARFMREVVEVGGPDVSSALAATEGELTWGFKKVFGRLEKMCDELRRDKSRTKLAQAVTLYHLIIEGTLAQPGQHYIESYLSERNWLPGFRQGIRNVALDEQRHVAFGVKLLADLIRQDPECRDAIAELLREVVPWTIAVFAPPNLDRSFAEAFGYTLEQIFADGSESFENKMKAIGMPLHEIPGVYPFPPDMPAEERAARAIKLLLGNLVGEKVRPPARDPEVLQIHFETLAMSVDHEAAREPATIQWDFPDAEPWHLVIDNGSTAARPGRVSDPDVTVSCPFEEWIDLVNEREDPRLALLLRKVRIHGSPRALWRTRKLFAR